MPFENALRLMLCIWYPWAQTLVLAGWSSVKQSRLTEFLTSHNPRGSVGDFVPFSMNIALPTILHICSKACFFRFIVVILEFGASFVLNAGAIGGFFLLRFLTFLKDKSDYDRSSGVKNAVCR